MQISAIPYKDNYPGTLNWQTTLSYITAHPNITEVILSGGDPLLVKDEPLKILITGLANIQHVKRIRIHSRLPIVLPERITDDLIKTLTLTTTKPILVIHSNHANEIDYSVAEAIKKVIAAGIMVLNQSVLLKNINDRAQDLNLGWS